MPDSSANTLQAERDIIVWTLCSSLSNREPGRLAVEEYKYQDSSANMRDLSANTQGWLVNKQGWSVNKQDSSANKLDSSESKLDSSESKLGLLVNRLGWLENKPDSLENKPDSSENMPDLWASTPGSSANTLHENLVAQLSDERPGQSRIAREVMMGASGLELELAWAGGRICWTGRRVCCTGKRTRERPAIFQTPHEALCRKLGQDQP